MAVQLQQNSLIGLNTRWQEISVRTNTIDEWSVNSSERVHPLPVVATLTTFDRDRNNFNGFFNGTNDNYFEPHLPKKTRVKMFELKSCSCLNY